MEAFELPSLFELPCPFELPYPLGQGKKNRDINVANHIK